MYSMKKYSPTMQMMDGNNYAKDPINSIASNPVGILRLQGGETMTDVFTGHVDLRFNLAKGLTFPRQLTVLTITMPNHTVFLLNG